MERWDFGVASAGMAGLGAGPALVGGLCGRFWVDRDGLVFGRVRLFLAIAGRFQPFSPVFGRFASFPAVLSRFHPDERAPLGLFVSYLGPADKLRLEKRDASAVVRVPGCAGAVDGLFRAGWLLPAC